MRERMLAGDSYNAWGDTELREMSQRAQRLMDAYNSAEPAKDRHTLLRELFGAVGKDSVVKPPFYCDYGMHIYAGDELFMNMDCVVLDCNEVHIGDHVQMGPKVQLYTATHPLDPDKRRTRWESALPITIGDDVWLGGGAIVCPGVSVGAGSTVGAGSVVTRDVPEGVFAAGNPCRVIRKVT